MSTANFGTPNFNLPLIAIGMGDDEDQNYWAYEDAEADLKLLNNELGYFTVYLESGYYQGAMYNVKQTNDYIDYDQIDDYDDEDDLDWDEDEDEEYEEGFDFGDEDSTIYEVQCICGEVINFDEETLEEGSIICPNCGESLEFDVEEDEE